MIPLLIVIPSITPLGIWTQLKRLSGWLGAVVMFSPLRWRVEISHGVLVRGAGLELPWRPADLLLALGSAMFGIALLRFRRQLRRRAHAGDSDCIDEREPTQARFAGRAAAARLFGPGAGPLTRRGEVAQPVRPAQLAPVLGHVVVAGVVVGADDHLGAAEPVVGGMHPARRTGQAVHRTHRGHRSRRVRACAAGSALPDGD